MRIDQQSSKPAAQPQHTAAPAAQAHATTHAAAAQAPAHKPAPAAPKPAPAHDAYTSAKTTQAASNKHTEPPKLSAAAQKDLATREWSGAAKTSGPAHTAAVAGAGANGKSDAVDRLIDFTARVESGGKYNAWNPNDAGHGVSYGLIQFNQKSGTLPTLMQRMHDANPQKFDQVFGGNSKNMLNSNWVRGANLNDPSIKNAMIKAGDVPEFQKAERDLAREGYFNPASQAVAKNGLSSERAHAMAFDTAVQFGVGGMQKMLGEAARGGGSEKEVLNRFANIVDHASQWSGNRRTNLLHDSRLSDGPLGTGSGNALPPSGGSSSTPDTQRTAPKTPAGGTQPSAPSSPAQKPAANAPLNLGTTNLQHGSDSTAVKNLQQSLVNLGYMTKQQMATGPGHFGPRTEAAVRKFQADHGATVDGVVGPQTRAALEKALGGAPAHGNTPAQGSGSTHGSAPAHGSGGTQGTDTAPAHGPTPSGSPNIEPGKYDGRHPAAGTTETNIWGGKKITPPLNNAPGNRSASNYAQVINQFAVGDNPRYQPRQGQTFCNIFAQDVTRQMGAPLPAMRVNDLVPWLHNQGGSQGWKKVSADEAQKMANEGHPSVVTWSNPNGVHGHVAVVRPGEITSKGPATAQSGSHTFNDKHVKDGFGNAGPLEYWVHA